jgi:GTP cyclohydrolase I|tara:strand:- start:281 stop:946 length:666 start_codon:yes stop_codon:yes gene_type:complete
LFLHHKPKDSKVKTKLPTPFKNYMINENFNIETLPLTEELKANFTNVINLLGENTEREGLVKTPDRAAKAMKFLTSGYSMNPKEILEGAMFKEDYKEMVIIKDIELYSLCEHHMLPFFGKAHIAYIPNGHIVGLSKIPRVVDVFARRLQVQERLTEQILDCINDTLKPQGVAVVIEASHMCMMMRGVQKQNSTTTTSGFRGAFKESNTRNEFLKLIASSLS